MKKNLLFLFALICSMSLFTACNDDDDPEYIQDGEFDGVYLGQLDVDAMGIIKIDDIPQKVYIAKTGENLIKMELKDFSFQTLNLGTIAVENIVAVKSGTNCTFTGSQKITLLVGECDVTVKGSIEGGKLDMDIDVLAAGTLNVKVDFEGTKMAADKSSEAAIKAFKVKVGELDIDGAIGADNKITFVVPEETEGMKFVPTITISDKATITPASGVEQDFASPVTYTVTSEDGIVKTNYVISIGGKATAYDFETWQTIEIKDWFDEVTWAYEIPATGGWAGADAALNLVKQMLEGGGITFNDKSLVATVDAHSGNKAAQITTVNTYGQASIGMGFPAIPKITSGSLFLGSFEIDVTNTLRSTRFGIEYDKEPLIVKGYYKYAPGKDYYRCDDVSASNIAVLDNTKKDECAISAVIYEVSSYVVPTDPLDMSDQRLNGTNVYKSPNIVASAQLVSGAQSEYTPFELKLTYVKPYDATKLYRFAIICSSSKDGDKFCGAPGSALIVDDVSVAYKK